MNYCRFRNDFIKRMATAGGGILPSEYQQVEYLQSMTTNGCYIDTGVIISSNNIRYVVKCNIIAKVTDNDRYWGSQGGANNYCTLFPWSYNNGKGRYPLDTLAAGSSFYLGSMTPSYNTIYDIDITANNGVIAGEYCGYNLNLNYSGSLVNGLSIYIFSCNLNNSTAGRGCNARFYKFEIYSGGEQKFNGIPCYRKADNKPGMYDLVTNTFFTNAGTGEFTVGNNV